MDKHEMEVFEEKVKKTILDHKLLDKEEKILVAASGGKDSTTILYLLNKWGYNVEALAIHLHIGTYSDRNVENVQKFCADHKIKLNLIDLREEFGSSICFIREGIQSKENISNCTICGVVKRWLLNKKAKELGAAKLVTGHNLNDESETVLMNLLKGNPELGIGMGPIAGGGNGQAKGFVQRIKPLYFCNNEEIREYSKSMDFPVVYEACPCSVGVFRRKLRNELAELEKSNPDVRLNLVNNFLAMVPLIKERSIANSEASGADTAVKACEVCGEPARNKVCRLCEMIRILRSPGKDKDKEKICKIDDADAEPETVLDTEPDKIDDNN